MSDPSDVNIGNNTLYWNEEISPWKIQVPEKGEYCLNQNHSNGVFVGHSVCNWTFKYGNHCIIPACRPINCSTYSHSLHVEGDMLWCLLSNATDEKLIPRRLSWAWVNETGHERQFNNFWSNTDLAGAQVLKESNPLACAISGITNQTVTIKCNYSNPIGAQKYDLWIKGKKGKQSN